MKKIITAADILSCKEEQYEEKKWTILWNHGNLDPYLKKNKRR